METEEYLQLITQEHKLESLIESSSVNAKMILSNIASGAIETLKSKDYLWDGVFLDKGVLEHLINMVIASGAEGDNFLLTAIDEIKTRLYQNDHNWLKKDIAEILDEGTVVAENFAMGAFIHSINGLMTDDPIELYKATQYESYIVFAEVSYASLSRSEQAEVSRKKGQASSKASRMKKSNIDNVVDETALKMWKVYPSLGVLPLAISIHGQLEETLNRFRISGCRAFYEHGLYEEQYASDELVGYQVINDRKLNYHSLPKEAHRLYAIEHPKDKHKVCIPAKLKTVNAIRLQVRKLKPLKTKIKIPVDKIDLEQKLREALKCSDQNCNCNKK